jgi:putative ATPase
MKTQYTTGIPLPERMRPHILQEILGQEELTGPDGIIQQMMASGFLSSMIFWGPPGTGKTTLATVIAEESDRSFFSLSAISSGVKEVREVIKKAEEINLFKGKPPILFIDEIHRFSKSQQDALLGAVEKGTIILIGATTENPSFEVISALLSRCQVYVLKPLGKEDLLKLAHRALQEDVIFKNRDIQLLESEALLAYSGGDARKLLNTLELVIANTKSDIVEIKNDDVERTARDRRSYYDKTGENHYDIISAFIKSMRGSDPNGAVYWLTRMLEGGEDPLFIARRMVILASEDIGNANPNALLLATSCFQAVQQIGLPEGAINLAHVAIYLSTSEKSNRAYLALRNAQKEIKKTGDLPVPLHLRNAPTSLMKDLNYGTDYIYPHDLPDHFAPQEYLPEEITGSCFYEPSDRVSMERKIKERLDSLWKERYSSGE